MLKKTDETMENWMRINRNTYEHIWVKLLKTKEKEEILQAVEEKRCNNF